MNIDVLNNKLENLRRVSHHLADFVNFAREVEAAMNSGGAATTDKRR